MGRQAFSYNGLVDSLRTTFVATGTEAEIAQFIGAVSAGLKNLPLDRLEHERKILLTEAERQVSGPLDWALAMRYGPRGPGLASQEEYGLHRVSAEDIAEWAARHFCAENVLLWMSGAPSDTLTLDLPSGGQRLATRHIDPVPLELPAWYEVGDRGFTLTSIVARSSAATALRTVLEHRLETDLRYERGISYETGAVYAPIGRDNAVQAIITDTLKQNFDQARDAALATVDDVASKGPTGEELDRYVAEMERAWTEPAAVPAILDSLAVSYLLNPDDLERNVIEEARAIKPAEVQEAADRFRSGVVAGVPVGSSMPKRYHRIPDGSENKVKGKTYRPARRSETAMTHHRLVQGDAGITLIQERGRFVTVYYDSCEGLIQWKDGLRVVLGSDGFMLRIHPNDWSNGKKVVAELDQRLGDRGVEMRTDPPPHESARWSSGTHLKWALASAFFGLGAVANLFDPEYQSDGTWVVFLLMALVLVPLCLYNMRRWYVSRKP